MQSIIKKLSFQSVVYGYLVALVFFLPFIFYSGSVIGFQMSKTIPILIFALLGIAYVVYTAFRDGKLTYTTNVSVIALIALPFLYVLSAFVNHKTASGLLGAGFESDTASFTLLLVICALIVSMIVRTRERVFYLFSAFGLSFAILAIYHILRMFAPDVIFNLITPDILSARTANTLGKWTEIGLLAGIVSITTCVSLEFLKVSKLIRTLLFVLLGISLVVVVFINFPIAYLGQTFVFSYASLVGLFSLVLFIYLLSSSYSHSAEGESKKRYVPYASLIVFVVGMIATLGYTHINQMIIDSTGVPRATVNYTIPTWQHTTNTLIETVKDKKFVGVGPGNFLDYFNANRPTNIVLTSAWNSDFKSGFSYIMTAGITGGIPVLIAWIVLILSLIYSGFKTLFGHNRDQFTSYILTLSYVTMLCFIGALILYSPTHVVLALAFIFIGVYMGMLFQDGQIKEDKFVFEDSKKKSFVTILSLVFVLVCTLIWAYSYAEKVIAASYIQDAADELAKNDANSFRNAERLINEARTLAPYDQYDQLFLQVRLNEVVSTLSQSKNSPETIANTISGLAADIAVINNSLREYNPESAGHDVFIGQVYQTFVPGIADAYPQALQFYKDAEAKYPASPYIKYAMATLNLTQGTEESIKLATQNLVDAIKLKPNYQDAYFLLARSLSAQGDKQNAIQSVRAGASLTPNEPVVLFQLGLVEYGAGNYAEAERNFKQAISFAGNQDVSSINYYLALTYYAQDRDDEAISVLESVLAKYPNSPDIEKVINNMKAGRRALEGINGQGGVSTTEDEKSSVTGENADVTPKTSTSTKATGTNTSTSTPN